MRWSSLGWVGVLVVSTVAWVPGPAAAVRWDELGTSAWGNLTWTGNGGRIVWGPNPNSADDMPPARSPSDLDQTLQPVNDLWGAPLYREGLPLPEPEVFVSDPTPVLMVLNVSRNIQVELNLKGNDRVAQPCAAYASDYSRHEPALRTELTLGGKFLGGATTEDWISWYWVYPSRSQPSDPEGYATCRTSMHAEATIIPVGSVITLRIVHVGQDHDYPIGFQGDHRSTIRFPLLPADEVPFRYPELAPPEDEGDEADGDAPAGGAAGSLLGAAPLAVLGAALVGAPRGSRRALFLALLLVAVALAGCVGGKARSGAASAEDARYGGRATNTLIRDDGALAKAGLGTILGQIYDDLHIPVPGVHVSVLGLTDFTQSDGKGRFKFLNLVPGVHKLRFDHKDYKSYETEIEVKPGFVSRPDVLLFLKNAKDRDYRAHSHDYWNGRTSIELMNAPVDTQYC